MFNVIEHNHNKQTEYKNIKEKKQNGIQQPLLKRAVDRPQRCLTQSNKDKHTAREKLNNRILEGERALARRALTSKQQIRENRNEFVPLELGVAGHASRPSGNKRQSGVVSHTDHIEKTAHASSNDKNENKICGVHAEIIHQKFYEENKRK